nr:NADH dehydrogenase subunit 5 [Branchinecta gaini]
MRYYIYTYFLFCLSITCLFLSFYTYSSDSILLLSFSLVNFSYQVFLDWISCSFLFLVALISSQVILYSIYYMSEEVFFYRFKYILLLFVLSMAFLIISSDGVSLLLGWDGLGVTSYALIMFYSNSKSSASAMITGLSNRVGDILILWALGLSYSFGSWDFFYIGHKGGYLILGLFLLASLTKSAQIPFSAWLPAAMAAPTPVSSLVHSSTLVTAGIYLMIRFSPSFSLSGLWMLIFLGSLTALFSGLAAVCEYDMKRIIALSTLSQLGVMMFSIGMGFPFLAYFHLFTHAMFKALLFMCSGVVIHASGGTQDIRRLGGILSFLPYSSLCLSVASCSLMGFPFMAGFYSKDLIIEISEMSTLIYPALMIMVAALFTCWYSFRLFKLCLTNPCYNFSFFSKYESGLYMISLFTLYWGALLGGFFFFWCFLGQETIMVSMTEKIILFTLLFLGMGLGISVDLTSKFSFKFLNSMGFLPFITGKLSVPALYLGEMVYLKGDQGWVEYFGPEVQLSTSYFMSSIHSLFFNVGYKLLLLSAFIGLWFI